MQRQRSELVPIGEALSGIGGPVKAIRSDELPFDYARDNEKLQGTDAYWELYQAQFE